MPRTELSLHTDADWQSDSCTHIGMLCLQDLVSMARPFLADPEILTKAKEGRVDEINTCIACNQVRRRLPASIWVLAALSSCREMCVNAGVSGPHVQGPAGQLPRQPTVRVRVRAQPPACHRGNQEEDCRGTSHCHYPVSHFAGKDGQVKQLVRQCVCVKWSLQSRASPRFLTLFAWMDQVGAGPAGLAFSTSASERGHDVTLFDADTQIGGQVRHSTVVQLSVSSAPLWWYVYMC